MKTLRHLCFFSLSFLTTSVIAQTTRLVPSEYANILQAVTAANAGDTVGIAAGTYNESAIPVNKELTITGAGIGNTVIELDGATGFAVDANNVTIRNLTIQNGTVGVRVPVSTTINSLTLEFVEFEENSDRGLEFLGTSATNVIVDNCIFKNNDNGIRSEPNSIVDGLTVRNSVFESNGFDIYGENNAKTGYISNLHVDNCRFEAQTDLAAIFLEELNGGTIENSFFFDNFIDFYLFKNQDTSGKAANNIVIRNNQSTGALSTSILIEQGSSEPIGDDGITIVENEITRVADALLVDSGAVEIYLQELSENGPITIEDNTISQSGTFAAGANSAHGVILNGGLETVVIRNNTFSGNGVTSLAIPATSGIAFNVVDSSGFQITPNSNVFVYGNRVSGFQAMAVAYRRSDNNYAGITLGATVVIVENYAVNAFGIIGGSLAVINASGNWWGTNDDASVTANMSGNVDFTPYLDSGVDVNSTTGGFQGDFGRLHVSRNGRQQPQSLGRIREGIDLVADGGIIDIEAGTYAENVTVDKAGLTLRGAGTDPNTVSVAPASGDGIVVTADQINLESFRVTNSANGIVAAGQNFIRLSHLVLDNNNTGFALSNVNEVQLHDLRLTSNALVGGRLTTVNTVVVSGRAGAIADHFTILENELRLNSDDAIFLDGVVSLTVNGGDGDDVFEVKPPPANGVAITVNGGDSATALPGDTLRFDESAPTPGDDGVMTLTGNFETVTYLNMETKNTGTPVISCPDTIYVQAMSGADNALATYAPPTCNNCHGGVMQIDDSGFTSGSMFPIGATLQSYEATSLTLDTRTCQFHVEVFAADRPIIVPGWNLISLPTELLDSGINTVLNELAVSTMWGWDESRKLFIPINQHTDGATLAKQLLPTRGWWVFRN